MFTGIITDIGTILALDRHQDLTLKIKTRFDTDTIAIGASIACHGICLSVVEKGAGWFSVNVSKETVACTNIQHWRLGDRINLESALCVGDALGGHIVSGHVDGLAHVLERIGDQENTKIVLQAPDNLAKFIAPKGSVALNGVSLTVNHVAGSVFTVNLISHTKVHTTWSKVAPGDFVNLEIDTIARYVVRAHEYAAEKT